MDFYLRATYLLSCLRRILSLLWETLSRCYLGEMSYLAQAKFVVCDYTIENGLHYRRDRTLDEDRSQLRMGHAPHVLALLNNTAIGLLGHLGQDNLPRVQRTFDYQFDKALTRLAA